MVNTIERELKDIKLQLERKTDEDIAYRRFLTDLLYNLDNDNVPYLNTVLKFQDDFVTAIAQITIEVSSQGASITNLLQFQQTVESAGYINSMQVEALISASVNDQGGSINSYLAGNFYTKNEVNNSILTSQTNIINSITQSITENGGSINSFLSGKFYNKIETDGLIYNSETSVTNSITQSITQSGGYINLLLAAQFADKNVVTSIEQRVSASEANISLVVQNGAIRGSMVIGAINNESYAVINASRISLAGKQINLTSDNISIQSNNFSVNSQGVITAQAGTIGGWTIGSDRLHHNSGQIGLAIGTGTNVVFWAGGSQTTAPYRVLANGTLYATGATISGNITATSGSFTGAIYASGGTIGGWTIGSNSIYNLNGTTGMASGTGSTVAFWAGGSQTIAPFRVTVDGYLYANNANISGTINATLGIIGGWVIGSASLYSMNSFTGLASGNASNTIMIWAGGLQSNAPFRVRADGLVTATNINIVGGFSGYLWFYQGNEQGFGAGRIGYENYNGINYFRIRSMDNIPIKIDSISNLSIDTMNGSSSYPSTIYIGTLMYTYQTVQIGYSTGYSLLEIRAHVRLHDYTQIYSAGTINFFPETNNPSTSPNASRRMYIAGYRILTEADVVFG